MKKNFCLLTLIFCFSCAFGQDYKKIDSLKQILKTLPELNGTKVDTLRIKTIINIATLYENAQPDSAIYYYQNLIDSNIFENEAEFIAKVQYNKEMQNLNAKCLYSLGVLYISKKEYLLSVGCLSKSLKIYDALNDKPGKAKCLSKLGFVSLVKANSQEAIEYYKKAIQHANDINDKQLLLSCDFYIGMAFFYMGEYQEAVVFYENSLKLGKEVKDKFMISRCLTGLGAIYSITGNYLKALDYYNESLLIAEGLGEQLQISRCLGCLGNLSFSQCDYPKAIMLYSKSLKISEELNDKQGISFSLGNLGSVSVLQCDYSKAMIYFDKSLRLAEEIGDKITISLQLSNIGNVSFNQGDNLKAIEYFKKSLDLALEIKDTRQSSRCLYGIGNILVAQREYLSAIKYFNESLEIAEELNEKNFISNCLHSIGTAFYNLNDYTKAIDYFKKSLNLKVELNDNSGVSNALTNLGNVFYDKNDYVKAFEYYDKSIKIKEEIGAKDYLADYYPKLAKIYIYLNNTEKALPLFLKSQEITFYLLKDNFSILSEKEKELYLNQTKGIFNDLHSFNINYTKQNDSLTEICYNNELILKGLLLKSTQALLNIASNSNDTMLRNSYFLLKQFRDKVSSLQGSEESNRDSLIADFENKANEQERKLVKLSSEFANIQNLFNYKWEDVQKNLKPGEAAIEFVGFTQGVKNDTTVYAALIVTPESKMPVSVKLFEDSELQNILGKSTGTGYDYVNSLYSKNNTPLYNLIWKPLESALAGISTIYYAPVGVLNKISFAALSKETGKMLCDIYNLQQVSTTGKLIVKDEANEMKMTAAVFGGIEYNPDTVKLEAWKYLPGTLNEKESIEKQFKKNKITCLAFSGKEAKEENFKSLFDSTDAPSILHVSTHGFFYPDPEQVKIQVKDKVEVKDGELAFRGSSGFGNWMFLNNKNPMMRSGLVFAGANRVWSEDWGRTDNEGVLTAYEVSNMNMRNTQLVVLSACETGLGDIKGSEGVYGLQRAFKMAGVKYIIMSLWQVPDKETVEFMEMFYKKLLKSKDVRTSFNETQKEMRKKYDPYFWAAFVLVE